MLGLYIQYYYTYHIYVIYWGCFWISKNISNIRYRYPHIANSILRRSQLQAVLIGILILMNNFAWPLQFLFYSIKNMCQPVAYCHISIINILVYSVEGKI
jgi:hypothetical protein